MDYIRTFTEHIFDESLQEAYALTFSAKWVLFNLHHVSFDKEDSYDFFSSPEPKAQVNYCHSTPSVRP